MADNYYISVPAMRRALESPNTDRDQLIGEYIEAASREIDAFCQRAFYTVTETRRFVPRDTRTVGIDELLSITTAELIDPDDSTVDAVEFEATAYRLHPDNGYPKLSFQLRSNATSSLVVGTDCLEIAGVWGYGDGTSDPWAASGLTGTVATTTGTTLTVSAAGLEVGQTIKIGTEQMFVTAVTDIEADPGEEPPVVESHTATVRRGMNGTTAAIQSAAAIKIAQYPARITQACRELVAMAFNRAKLTGLDSESVDGYAAKVMSEADAWRMLNRILSGYTRQ